MSLLYVGNIYDIRFTFIFKAPSKIYLICKLLVTDIFIILHTYRIFVYYGHLAYTLTVVSILLTNLITPRIDHNLPWLANISSTKRFAAYYTRRTRNFIAVLIRTRHWFLSGTKPIQCSALYSFSLRASSIFPHLSMPMIHKQFLSCGVPHQNPADISLIPPWIIHASPI
jgi:hypothetical protein